MPEDYVKLLIQNEIAAAGANLLYQSGLISAKQMKKTAALLVNFPAESPLFQGTIGFALRGLCR